MKLLSDLLAQYVRHGTLRLIDSDGRTHVFAGTPEPDVTVRINDPNLHRKLFLNPELHAGEAYMDGRMEMVAGSLEDLLLLLYLNRGSLRAHPWQQGLRRLSKMLKRLHQHNPVGKAQKNVAHHYDLSTDLYRLFLDEDLQYSCAYFLNETDSLEQAQAQKKRHVAAKLLLRPGHRVLDIGCGWGGLSLYLARQFDVSVTGVTLSKEQHGVAQQRAAEMGLHDRVRFELRDYRELDGPFDRIVSVGMFEHVGVSHYDEFFAKLRQLLARDGLALLHSIGRRSPPGATSAWLRKYIFPGGYIPALSEVFPAVERQKLWVNDVEVLRLHYADTLREWNRRFQERRAEAAQLYDERLCRMWEVYLAGSALPFSHGNLMVFQMQLARRRDAAPRSRDYMFETEQALARKAEREPAG